MAKYSVNADRKRGKKLEKSLEKLFPDKSWRARSLLLEIPDSTVVGWRNGREISCSGLSRLFDVGCDITYILTGKEDAEHKITHALRFMQPEEVENAELKQKNFPPAEASGERDVGNDLLGELRGESNFNQKRYSVLIDKEVAGDVPYNQKGI